MVRGAKQGSRTRLPGMAVRRSAWTSPMAYPSSYPAPPSFGGGYLIFRGLLALASCKDSDERARSAARTASEERSMKPPVAKIDAQQAIAAATAAVPGSAREVRLESRAGKLEYEVT